MGFMGAGFAVGAANAVSEKLNTKAVKEEARYAFLKEAIDKGESEFKTGLSDTKGFNKELYADTRDWVTANILKDVVKTDGNNVAEYSGTLDLLDSMGVPVYVQGPTQNNKFGVKADGRVINPLINEPENQELLIEGLTKIGLAKMVSAQRSGNFDIESQRHRHAVLDVRLGGQSGIKASVLRENMDDPRSPIVNKSIVNDGFDLGQYAEPIAEKIGLGKRISNFFNAADDTEILRGLAKEKGISIEAAKRLVSAGKTDEIDAFETGNLEESLGSQYGDLPDVSLSNLSTLIPSDKDTIDKMEAYIIQGIQDNPEDFKDASFIDPNLPEMAGNITFNPQSKLFMGKDGKEISNKALIDLYTPYTNKNTLKVPEGNIVALLPEYNPETDMHRADDRNITQLSKRIALTIESARNDKTRVIDIAGISAAMKKIGLPGIGDRFSDNSEIIRVLSERNTYRLDKKSMTFGFVGSNQNQRKTISEVFYDIAEMVAATGDSGDEIAKRSHIIMQRYLVMTQSNNEMTLQ